MSDTRHIESDGIGASLTAVVCAWRGLPGASISEAMNRGGFREVYKIVGAVASDALVSQPLGCSGRNALST